MLFEREMATLTAFTLGSKHERYSELLRTKRGREKVRLSLDHFGDLNLSYCKRVPAAEQTPSGVLALLQKLGAPVSCYVLSSNNEVDGQELELEEALNRIIGRGCGAFVCCIPGKLAYFEGENPGERFVCRR